MFDLFLAVIGVDDALVIGGLAAAMGGFSSWLGNKNSKKSLAREAATNYRYQLLMSENGPSSMVKGLRKAGLNPILTATDGSFSTPSMPKVGGDSSNTGDISSAMSAATQMAQSSSTMDLQDTQADLNKAQEKLTGIKAANELANRGLDGKFGAISRVLSEFGFDSKTVKDMLPAFQTNKNVPNGSERLTNAVKSQNVPSSLSSFEDAEDYLSTPEAKERYKILKENSDRIYKETGERPPVDAIDKRFEHADKYYRKEKYRRHSSIYTR